jgi:serine/threonine-protein kinase RsbW
MEIEVRNDVAELERLNGFLNAFWTSNQLPKDALFDFNLVLEEIFTNVVFHGYQDEDEHAVYVGLTLEDGTVSLTVEDEGTPFNPLEAPDVDVNRPIGERRIGGLGIHLVRKLMDRLEYAREGNRNRLVMTKRVSRSA